tara:strand:- start:1151 stop:1429 length:279 start_codon:yes stop_codon:yes gene_type:complete
LEIDPKSIEQSWKSRGFSCEIWTDLPGTIWADFIHKTDELVMLIDREIELEMSGQIFHPEIEEEILIPAGVNHTVRNICQVTNQWFYGYKHH